MAHHQGMSLVALTNVLHDDVVRRWGMADARLAAVASLLQERMPREVSRLLEPPPAPSLGERREAAPATARNVVPGETALQPTQLLSNGRYSVTLRANGAGWSRFGDADVTRWRDDALRDGYGTFFYLRRTPGSVPVSITQHPGTRPGGPLPGHFPQRPHGVRHGLGRSAQPLHSLGQPRGRHRAAPHCAVEYLVGADHGRVAVDVRAGAGQGTRRRGASGLFQSVRQRPLACRRTRAVFRSATAAVDQRQGRHAVHFMAQARRPVAVGQAAGRPGSLDRPRSRCHVAAGNVRTRRHTLGTLSTGLDPIASLSMQLALPAHGVAHLVICTAAATSRDSLETLVDRYRQPAIVERAALMSATLAGARSREMRLSADDRAALLLLTTTLVLLLAPARVKPVRTSL